MNGSCQLNYAVSAKNKEESKMKKIFLALILLFIFSSLSHAKQVTLQFAWDPNTESDMAGYAIFQRMEGQQYNYDDPIDPDCTIVDGKCYVDPVAKTCEFTHIFEVPDGVISTFYWVARARDGVPNWSEDSNEVSMTFDLAPIVAPIISTAVFNEVERTVDIVFQQADSLRVTKWELYMSNSSGGPYTKAGEIVNTGTEPYSTSWSIPGDGDYYFVLVAFTPEGVFSQNSNEMYVQVKEHPSPVKEYRIKIRIQ